MTASGNQICFFFIVNIEKNKIRIKKINLDQSTQVKSLPQTYFFLGFIKSTDPPTNRPPTTYPPTHRLPTQRLTESIIIFERLDTRNIFILQNTSTAEKTYNYTSVYYPKRLLVSIKHIRKIQLFLFS